MSKFRKHVNNLGVCLMCNRRTHVDPGLKLCRTCEEQAGTENEHLDGYHQDKARADCRLCNPKKID